MKYKDRDELVADLRELADFLEWKGHKLPMELWYPKSFGARFYESDDVKPIENMKRVAKVLGKAEKHFNLDFELVRTMSNGHVQLRFETQRENVCKKVVVGTEQVPKRRYVDIPGEFDEKEIVEWQCDEPLLAQEG
jgi:hypothetical protein